LVAHLHFLPTHKATLKNAKELPSQRTTPRQLKRKTDRPKKGQQVTEVLQKWGISAKFEHWEF